MTPALRRQAMVIVVTLSTAYVASHFFRASNVTIGLDLMRDLRIGPEALGALTGAFFFGFAGMQIPCGVMFDRFGPRLTVFGMLLLAIVGGTIFTTASNLPTLLLGRTLMGAGVGVMLAGSMVVISRWYPADRFSTLSAMVLFIGLIGNLLATTPLAWAAGAFGWRPVFVAGVAFTAVTALGVLLVVRDAPPGHPFLARQPESVADLLAGLVEVLRTPGLPLILTLAFTNYACTFTVQGLWGGPYLREIHGFTKIEAGNVLLAAVVAYQVGQITFGPLDRVLDTRKWIAFCGTSTVAMIMVTLALWAHPPAWFAAASMVVIGFVSSSSTMVMAHGRGTFPDRLIGRGMSVVISTVMAGVACMQSLSGIILGLFPVAAGGTRTALAYRGLFGVMGVILIGALAVYSRSRDIRPSEQMRGAKS